MSRRLSFNRQIKTLANAYMTAKEKVIQSGFACEIDWQHNLSLERITEDIFLREAAWVVLSAGMRESVIRRKFPEITAAFCNWESARLIISHREKCKCDAMEIFRNERKIESILKITEEVYYKGFEIIRKFLEKDGVKYIDRLPFMGPATSFHLAKNLGLPTVKPDRHLTRVAFRTGYSSPYEMCKTISEIIGDKITVIDLVIWRYATLDPNYLVLFCPSDI